MAALFELFSSSGPSQPPPTSTSAITTSMASSTSSTSSTPTATVRPYVIIAHSGTKPEDFDSLVETLPPHPLNLDVSARSVGYFAIIAFMNETFAKGLSNPVINLIVDDTPAIPEGNVDLGSTQRRQVHNSTYTRPKNKVDKRQDIRVPIKYQHPAPIHLNWLGTIEGVDPTPFYTFSSGLVYLEKPHRADGATDIYIVDNGMRTSHKV